LGVLVIDLNTEKMRSCSYRQLVRAEDRARQLCKSSPRYRIRTILCCSYTLHCVSKNAPTL